ncbi:hypothetical protein L1887_11589 [Cichorium endivia]|nr:hypothetical protein L1887_11589 [Cichorium endivia]
MKQPHNELPEEFIRVLKDGGEYDRADKFYKDWCVGKVELNDLELDSDSESISLISSSSYNTLIDLYGKAGRLKDAGDVFAEMLQSGIAMDTITFNTMIFTCGSHENLSEAESLLHKMEE